MSQEVLLKLDRLTKKYREIVAVDDLSLEVYRGEIFGLLGPNGAGKTTTINLIAGVIEPDSGQIFLRGENIQGNNDLRREIGICPQENIHWNKLTSLEQLAFLGQMYDLPPARIKERSRVLIEALGLEEGANRLAGKLSGGMQRRLNIALALIHDPRILILDEPEAGLDPQSRISIREYIKSLAQEKTVILTTHNMDEAQRMADRVAIIDRGTLLVLDTPDSLTGRVGEGDVLEIEIINQEIDPNQLDLPAQTQQMMVGNSLHIRGLDLVNQLPEIIASLDRAEVQRGEIRLRKNTLEDVFIQLTGRRLRD